jgi:sulfoxide reductase catalytic subunit YedY
MKRLSRFLSMAYLSQQGPRKISESDITAECVFLERRRFLGIAGYVGLLAAGAAFPACGPAREAPTIGAQQNPPASDLYPASRDTRFRLDRPLTDEAYAASYNNFYEFSTWKGGVYKKSARLRTSPWQVEVGGLVEKPRVFDIDELIRAMPLEERLYRFRCVEAWPWRFPGPVFRCVDSSRVSGRCHRRSTFASSRS